MYNKSVYSIIDRWFSDLTENTKRSRDIIEYDYNCASEGKIHFNTTPLTS